METGSGRECAVSNELSSRGCAKLQAAAPADLIAAFEVEIDELASFHLRRLGVERNAADALTDLLRHGGEFRRLLFPHLKNLPSVSALARSVRECVEASGFLENTGMRFPSMHWLLKADVPGESRYLLPMHQDYNTPCHHAWRAWVPLRDASEANGTMRFVAGSQAAGFIAHDTSNPELPTVPSEEYDEDAVELLEMPAGDAFLFHPLLFHASVPARDDVMKYALIVNFWDIASLADPDDPEDRITARLAMGQARDSARGDHKPIRAAMRS